MVSKRKFKRDYIILEAKDMNFRSKERVLPKAFAKIEINDEKSVVALYVENLKNLKDGYDVIALRTDYERLNLGRINLNSQGKGEFILDLNEEDSDIKAIALTYEKYIPLIGFKGNKIENYDELIFEQEEIVEEIVEYEELDGSDNDDYEIYEEIEYIEPENPDYEYEQIEYVYEDDLESEEIEGIEEPIEIEDNQVQSQSYQLEQNQQEYEYIQYEEITNQELEDVEYEYEYEEINDEELKLETQDKKEQEAQQIKPKKECAKPLQLPKEERKENKLKQQKQISKNKNKTRQNNIQRNDMPHNNMEYSNMKQSNIEQEQPNASKNIKKNNDEFEEKISAGKLLMPRQIKKGLKYFKEVKPFVADYIPNTRWWKIEITPTTMSGYTMPYLGYVNSLNYTMYSDIAMNSYKYRHYLFGVQYDEYNKRKNYIYAIPGKKSEQPDKGTTGFTTYQVCDNRNNSLGYWMCFIDSKARKIEK